MLFIISLWKWGSVTHSASWVGCVSFALFHKQKDFFLRILCHRPVSTDDRKSLPVFPGKQPADWLTDDNEAKTRRTRPLHPLEHQERKTQLSQEGHQPCCAWEMTPGGFRFLMMWQSRVQTEMRLSGRHEIHAANFKTLKADCLSLEPALPNPTVWRPGASYFICLCWLPPLKM